MSPRLSALLVLLFISVGRYSSAEQSAPPVVQNDVEYGQTNGVKLKLDLQLPPGPGPFPACLLVHGGGFSKGDKAGGMKKLFKPLTEAGFACFSINYRLAPEHRWPAFADDVQTAIRWLKRHAADYRVDASRIALIGDSAGGYLVSYCGARPQTDTGVAAVVSFYGAHDREFQIRRHNVLEESTRVAFEVNELNEATWAKLREVSANTYIHPGMPPYLLLHGDRDANVPLEQSQRFQQQMQAQGNRCELIVIPGGGHGFTRWNDSETDFMGRTVRWLTEVLVTAKR
ncbi:alpha/beta hydrolase [Planctomicrobium sp. SH664]|uniref:alpha/beta hydrolase n=1 Tax=Planctomicrobium sp. SH664 TaxID=3448125 RepID=UPI003F5B9418